MPHVTKEFYQVCPKWFLSLWYVRHKLCTYIASRLALSPTKPKCASTWALLPRSIIGCVQNDFWAYGTFGTKPCAYLAPTLTLYPNVPKWDSTWPMSPRTSIRCVQNDFWAYGMFSASRPPILQQGYHYLQKERIELLLDPRHLGVPSGASKTISKPMARLVQTVHLSCTNTNTVPKQTEMRFHMTHITLEFHRVCPKLFPSQWYVQHKPCTYHASLVALSLNGPNWASTRVSLLRSTIGCVQNDFWAYSTFVANRAPILQWH
jgi:hypothetical protein